MGNEKLYHALCGRVSIALEVSSATSVRNHSLIRDGEIVEIDVVRILILISVHLVVDGHAVPVGRRTVAEGPV